MNMAVTTHTHDPNHDALFQKFKCVYLILLQKLGEYDTSHVF